MFKSRHLLAYIKQIQRLVYKKGSAWPVSLNEEKNNLLKWLYAVKLSKIINEAEVIINIDESSFSW